MNGTQISLQVQEYYHARKHSKTKFNSFIVSVRHPIERMVSWFLHQHTKNKIISHLLPIPFIYNCFD